MDQQDSTDPQQLAQILAYMQNNSVQGNFYVSSPPAPSSPHQNHSQSSPLSPDTPFSLQQSSPGSVQQQNSPGDNSIPDIILTGKYSIAY